MDENNSQLSVVRLAVAVGIVLTVGWFVFVILVSIFSPDSLQLTSLLDSIFGYATGFGGSIRMGIIILCFSTIGGGLIAAIYNYLSCLTNK